MTKAHLYFMRQKRSKIISVVLLLLVSAFSFFGCSNNTSNANLTNSQTASQSKNTANANPANRSTDNQKAASFINKVWKVNKSSGVTSDHLYVFLSEGTLVITSPQSKPALGSWAYKNGALNMTEESITYKVDIVKLTETEFAIKIYNPGQPTEIEFIQAPA
jgi:hypothetical protein